MYEYIPDELKKLRNWVCWKACPDPKPDRPDHISKKPVNPYTGGNAMSNNPDTWSDYDTAVRAAVSFSGIGFMFDGKEYFGVDIDGHADELAAFEKGDSSNIIGEFIHTLCSYSERSQSGRGIHIICRGHLPKGGRRNDKSGVEMYEKGRFFVMTGDICAEYADITDCTQTIKILHEKYIGGGREPQERKHAYSEAPDLSVPEALEKARTSKQGRMFCDLWGGNYEPYFKSQSEADLSLCNILAFWLKKDPGRIDEAFRQSGLYREKWDRKQSGSTYGRLTIQKAIDSTVSVYEANTSNYSVTIAKDTEVINRSCDDMGNARRILDLYGDDVKYSHVEKRWMYYDGRRWTYDDTGAVYRMADSMINNMSAEYKRYIQENGEDDDITKAFMKHMKQSRSNRAKKAMIAELMHNVPITPGELDREKMLINAPNGIIDLQTGRLVKHNRELYITKILSAEYSDHTDCPQWQKFLDEIFDGDKELISYIHKAVGYSLTGLTSEQCIFFLYGTGRNGKSTFLEIIRSVFGDYIMNIQPETILVKGQNSSARSDIARLKGARLVTTVEPNEGARLNEGLIKQLTGDDPVTARKLYSDEFEFKPEFKLWMATNYKPIIRGTDTGIWRRIHLIPFSVQIPEDKVDKKLIYKLTAELPAILKWAVDGCILYQKEGLRVPAAVIRSTEAYKKEMDTLSNFLDSCCIIGENETVQASELYALYTDWCERYGEYRFSSTKFGTEMGKRFKKVKMRAGNGYKGVGAGRGFSVKY